MATWLHTPWCNLCAHNSGQYMSVYSVVSVYKCIAPMYMYKLSLHTPQQKAKQEAATASADHKESEVKEGVAEEEGEWVEYVDSFGRTRRCPKEDLPHI